MKRTKNFFKKLGEVFSNKTIRNKILFTLAILAIYRLLVFVPVPFADIGTLLSYTLGGTSEYGYFVMLLGGALDQFAFIAIGISPYITASIIMQLAGVVIPAVEELSEQGEVGQAKINQYTRYLTLPFAFLQGIGSVYLINSMLGGAVIETTLANVLLSAFVMTVGAIMLMWLGELITSKGISNGISMLIFASIVAGITQQLYGSFASAQSVWGMALFMLVIVLVLVILSILILKSVKEIAIIYAKQGKVQQSSMLPIPLNPVGMVPIIFAMAFVSFPYLLAKLVLQFNPANTGLVEVARWVETHFNIYSQNPGVWAVLVYVIFIVLFTFFYAMITFSPDRISDNIQKRGGFIPGIRPGKATAQYINKILMHLCLWGGLGLALIGIYTYVLQWLPFVQSIVETIGSLPMVVTGSGVIIIVGVVQEIINKIEGDLVMKKYEAYE
ncbi:MAG: preprotein translocase subunit SecY [candidate division SR1 bacterium]|nr:MAG: preprotein translocase subunit SecY [candidate division SR1 bacterium]